VNWEDDEIFEVLKIAMEDLHSKKRQRKRIIDEVQKYVDKLPKAKQDAIKKSIEDKKNNLVVVGDHEKVADSKDDDVAKVLRSVDIVAEEDLVQ
jgi:glycerol-3-phosphate cytidylyltransferase-like family protein